MSPDNQLGEITHDHLLGGRVRYCQPRRGFRVAIDPVLLAAAIPAKPGDLVLEGGTGAGAALLCLAARVPGLRGIGVDLDVPLLGLAKANAEANHFPDLWFAAADAASTSIRGTVDHAFANPPYHTADGTPPGTVRSAQAKRAGPEVVPKWVRGLSDALRHRGTLTLILAPSLLESCLTAMRDVRVPAEMIYPVWPREGRAARFVLVQGRKLGRSPIRIMPGLVLHAPDGSFRSEADAILRDAAPLPQLAE